MSTPCACSDPCDCDVNAGGITIGENDFGDQANPPNPTPGALCGAIPTADLPTSTQLGATY